jgi:predicted metal-dependent hydrolase
MDLLLSRYNSIEYVMDLPIIKGLELIQKAFDKREEEKAWQMWLMRFQHMTQKNFVPFSQFMKKAIRPIVEESSEPTEDLIAMAEKIKAADQVKAPAERR